MRSNNQSVPGVPGRPRIYYSRVCPHGPLERSVPDVSRGPGDGHTLSLALAESGTLEATTPSPGASPPEYLGGPSLPESGWRVPELNSLPQADND